MDRLGSSALVRQLFMGFSIYIIIIILIYVFRWEQSSPIDQPLSFPQNTSYLYCKIWWFINFNVSVIYSSKQLRLEIRVKQHVPQELFRRSQKSISGYFQIQESAIGDYLSNYFICRTNYSGDCFSVLYKTRCKKHLAILEAIAITLFHPSLCRLRRQFDNLW